MAPDLIAEHILRESGIPCFIDDIAGNLVFEHHQWSETFAIPEGNPHRFKEQVHQADSSLLEEFLQKKPSSSTDASKSFSELLYRIQISGVVRWINLRIQLIQQDTFQGYLYQVFSSELLTSTLAHLNNRYQLLWNFLNVAPMSVCIRTPDRRYLMANRLHSIEINCNMDQLSEQKLETVYHNFPEIVEREIERDQWIFENHIPLTTEEEVYFEGLSEFDEAQRAFYMTHRFPLFNDGGETEAVGLIRTDVTESRVLQERTEQELKKAKDEMTLKVLERTTELRESNRELVKEIHKRQSFEERLRHRIEMERFVIELSSRFVSVRDKLDMEIQWSLQNLAKHMELSSAFFLLYDENGNHSRTFEWSQAGIEAFIQAHQNMDMDAFLESAQRFENDHRQETPLNIGSTDDVDDAMWSFGQLVNLPIIHEGRINGFLGCESLNESKLWYVADIKMFSMIGEIFVRAWNFKIAEDKLFHARQKEAELKTAAAVQQALFPLVLPQISKVELAAYYRSASETGGDWYGIFDKFKDHVFFLIGDATGHGAPAALVTAGVCATSRTLEELWSKTDHVPSPAEIMTYLNKSVYESGHPHFMMTFFILSINLKTLTIAYSNAGHNFPYLLRSGSTALTSLLNKNPLLGYSSDTQYDEVETKVEWGDKLFFYTDGLIENMNAQEKCWNQRILRNFLKQHTSDSATSLTGKLVENIHQFYGNHPLNDDVTILCCELNPHASGGKIY
ncbi:MAG: SpoIIE family protein phosphatase [SAR324 cluster bacterium]|nr:SpoIIE family protein phosphatase [SAR324 cluster bacterium]